MNPQADGAGLRLYPGYLDRRQQADMLAAIETVLAAAPFPAPGAASIC